MEKMTFGELGKLFSVVETRRAIKEFEEMYKFDKEESKVLDEAFKASFEKIFGVRPK